MRLCYCKSFLHERYLFLKVYITIDWETWYKTQTWMNEWKLQIKMNLRISSMAVVSQSLDSVCYPSRQIASMYIYIYS